MARPPHNGDRSCALAARLIEENWRLLTACRSIGPDLFSGLV
jgi:hypothetical protein